ncbi:alpha/beta hydrolase [Sphingobacterium deserti]|uniref:Putative alpha-dextrin endo-1,6-alpha-glucosidase n=1 Tax=Sphingobacterium deserti TaxID=1229276 RepID=A0A0B8T6N9_9SPHI|nr:alpha/beta hydrolase-fold protein [Sphingobacterium deserti]KGE13764.1 putative alpha-dextrin endo-1,6-alpha-glucosidase [Sphingobacterium deserti]
MSHETSYQVTLTIINNSSSFIGEMCYLAGNFNNWSADSYPLGSIPQQDESLSTVLSDVRPGDLELKITRGSWETLQSTTEGKLPPPFTVNVNHDLEISLEIDAWRDEFPASTATPQVQLLDAEFLFPNMGRTKKVYLYLPADYANSNKRYPVFYMHDGQHLFDEATSVGRAGPVEWMVDETLDGAEKQVIVVAIDHAETFEERQQEFLIHPIPETPKPLGEAYLQDIVSVLKPYIDKQYRTLADRANTVMIGSSLGGLVSLYAGLTYPDIFGTLAIFSPSIWIDRDGVYAEAEHALANEQAVLEDTDFYFYVGGREKRLGKDHHHENMGKDLREFLDFFEEKRQVTAAFDMDSHGKHGALYWQQAFKRFYTYWESKSN